MKILRTLVCVIALGMMACTESPKADLGEAPAAKDIVAQAQTIQNDNKEFQITIKAEREDGKYKVGEEIGLIFTSNRDAYVNIIDIGTSGKVQMIFPNAWHTSNKVEKDKTYRIPPKDAGFVFRVTPPAGVNYVKAIATLNKPDCVNEKHLVAKGNFFEVKDPLLAMKDIQAELRKVDPKQWTEAATQVIIEEGKPAAPAQALKPVEESKPPQPQQDVKPVDTPAPGTPNIAAEAQKIRNDGKAFNVKLWTEGDKTSYNAGEPVVFLFSTDRDCYLTLIDVGTSGKVYRIFPNKWHESNKVEKGKTYRIPPEKSDFIFTVTGPAGTEYVKAIATLEPVKCLEKAEMEPKGAFAEIKDPGLVLKDIAMELRQQDVKTWAEADVSFQVRAPEASTPVAPKPTVKLSTEKQTYKVGEPMSFAFQCDQDCSLTLLDIGSSGKVHIIFPNAVNKDNVLKAGTVHRIPLPDKDQELVYRVVSPPGPNTVKAICTFKPAKILPQELPAGAQIFPLVGDKEEILKQVREALAKLEPAHYAETDVTVQITE